MHRYFFCEYCLHSTFESLISFLSFYYNKQCKYISLKCKYIYILEKVFWNILKDDSENFEAIASKTLDFYHAIAIHVWKSEILC